MKPTEVKLINVVVPARYAKARRPTFQFTDKVSAKPTKHKCVRLVIHPVDLLDLYLDAKAAGEQSTVIRIEARFKDMNKLFVLAEEALKEMS
jgi:hypothetical protein